MEDTLRGLPGVATYLTHLVLILVLMEDTLRVGLILKQRRTITVLILVLMEDTLRAFAEFKKLIKEKS